MKKYILLISFSFYALWLQARANNEFLSSSDSSIVISEQNAYKLNKRLYFFSDSSNEEKLLVALCEQSMQLHKWNDCINYTTKILYKTNNDSLTIKYYHQLLQALLLSGDFNKLYNYINLNDSIHYLNTNIRYINLLYKGLSCIQLNHKAEAISYFDELAKMESDSIKKRDLIKLNTKYYKSKLYNPNQARIRSLIVPGLGQLYARDYKNAANSFLLNASLVSLMVITANYYTWLESALFWNQPVLHYYLGGSDVATSITVNKVNSDNEKIYNEYLKLLKPNFPGI